jgi:hypothetical protein
MANAANLINFGGGGSLAVGDFLYSPTGLTTPTYLPMNDQYASYLVSSYPTLGALYTTPAATYAATGVTPPSAGTLGTSIAYGNGVWVIPCTASTAATALVSTDGVNWVKRPTVIAVAQVAYGNGRFIGISTVGTCAYSFDGITWVQGTNLPASFLSISYLNGNFLVYRDAGGSGTIYVTTNGINWNTVASGTIPETNMVYGNGTIVVSATPTYNASGYSKDGGFTWSNVTVSGGSGLAFGNNIFVSMPASGSTSYRTSPDGITWTTRTFPAALNWQVAPGSSCIAFGNGVFLAVSSTSGTSAYSSPDGINWTARVLPSTRTWYSVTYGGPPNAGYFIAIGASTTDNIAKITLSATQTSFSLPLVPSIVSNAASYIKAS